MPTRDAWALLDELIAKAGTGVARPRHVSQPVGTVDGAACALACHLNQPGARRAARGSRQPLREPDSVDPVPTEISAAPPLIVAWPPGGVALPFEVRATFRSGTTPFMNPGEPTILPLAFPLLLSLPQPGRYCFTLSVDEEELDRYSFRVRQVSQVVALPPPASAGGSPGPGRR